jgi:ribokinase
MHPDSRPRILVVGSLNVDHTLRVPRLPLPGETLTATATYTEYGGKGANQAVAAARAGGSVALIGCVGRDEAGSAYLEYLRTEGLDTRWIRRVTEPTGTAYIAVADSGENQILVSPGANHALGVSDLDQAAEAFRDAKALLLQFEVPLESVRHAAGLARSLSVPVFLNPSPWREDLLTLGLPVDVLIVNELEAAQLLGEDAAALTPERAEALREKARCQTLVITRGSRSTWAFRAGESAVVLAPPPVTPVDTVGAGDTFAGALAVRLAEGCSLAESVAFANTAGALATLRAGAQPAIPRREQIERGLPSN